MTKEVDIKKRIEWYLYHSKITSPGLSEVMSEIKEKFPETVIFGGFIRVLSFEGAKHFSSDIDLVTKNSFDEILNFAKKYNPSVNKFGGIRFSFKSFRFDIWSLRDTWAFKSGAVDCNNFKDLLKTTFFNKDAAFYHLGSRELALSSGCRKALKDGVFDINLKKNPNPEGMARKAIDYYGGDGVISRNLAIYIIENANVDSLSVLEGKILHRLRQDLEISDNDVFAIQPDLFETPNI